MYLIIRRYLFSDYNTIINNGIFYFICTLFTSWLCVMIWFSTGEVYSINFNFNGLDVAWAGSLARLDGWKLLHAWSFLLSIDFVICINSFVFFYLAGYLFMSYCALKSHHNATLITKYPIQIPRFR